VNTSDEESSSEGTFGAPNEDCGVTLKGPDEDPEGPLKGPDEDGGPTCICVERDGIAACWISDATSSGPQSRAPTDRRKRVNKLSFGPVAAGAG
jgi:hypothetical protein